MVYIKVSVTCHKSVVNHLKSPPCFTSLVPAFQGHCCQETWDALPLVHPELHQVLCFCWPTSSSITQRNEFHGPCVFLGIGTSHRVENHRGSGVECGRKSDGCASEHELPAQNGGRDIPKLNGFCSVNLMVTQKSVLDGRAKGRDDRRTRGTAILTCCKRNNLSSFCATVFVSSAFSTQAFSHVFLGTKPPPPESSASPKTNLPVSNSPILLTSSEFSSFRR
jgi:hypothetical protein